MVVWECFGDVCDPACCRKILKKSYCREGSFITQTAKLSTPLITYHLGACVLVDVGVFEIVMGDRSHDYSLDSMY